MKDPRCRMLASSTAQLREAAASHTDTADHKYFSRPAIAVPAGELFLARQPGIFTGVLGTSIKPVAFTVHREGKY